MSANSLLVCRDDAPRRAAIRAGALNGLDFIDVDVADKTKLRLHFIAAPGKLRDELTPANFTITGGRGVRDIAVTDVRFGAQDTPDADVCTASVDRVGDISTYTLRVVAAVRGHGTDQPHPGFDPQHDSLCFSFASDALATLDCASAPVCPPPVRVRPEIDYLAKDYASFRQLLLDRLALTLPAWTERSEPDLLLALVELLAYEGDRLSYLQDAVATEAYLHTARQRISLRRHARLVDCFLREGCNARAWVFVEASEDSPSFSPEDFFFATSHPGASGDGTPVTVADLAHVPATVYEVFEPLIAPPAAVLDRCRVRRPGELCNRLRQGDRPVDRLLRDRLTPTARAALDEWGGAGTPPPALLGAVMNELDRMAGEQSLATERAFAAQRLALPVRDALRTPRNRAGLVSLNRMVLESAFAEELTPVGHIRFVQAHNAITIYSWGERDCCLPRGATMATLVDRAPDAAAPAVQGEAATPARVLQLQPGDFLLFEEAISPTTGLAADADPHRRWVVRLTSAARATDPVTGTPVLNVTWAPEDALPLPFCVSAIGPPPDCKWLYGVTVARGNVLLTDHGRRYLDEFDAVEVDAVQQPCEGCHPEEELVPRRYRPVLQRPDLTFAQPLAAGRPAASLLAQDPAQAVPQLRLQQVPVAPTRLDSPDPLQRYRNPLATTAFDPEDLIEPVPLLLRLQSQGGAAPPDDPPAAYLRGRLDDASLTALQTWSQMQPPPHDLLAGVLAALNAALADTGLYTPTRFPDPGLDVPTRTLLAARPLPIDLARLLNRWLLKQSLGPSLAHDRRFVRDWTAVFDLLEASGDQRKFVVEMSNDRRAHLRFGDDQLGHRPEAVTRFRAFYRTGNGTPGNVGAEAITVFVLRNATLGGITLRPRNPLPAAGGTDPETLDEVQQRAPFAIKGVLARAVIAQDYADLAVRDFPSQLQGAAAELVWTGSWHGARVTLDPFGRESSPPGLVQEVRADLEQYRRIGHELRVGPAIYVPLAVSLHVFVMPSYQQAHVRAALLDRFAARPLPDGTLGFFAPDNLRFGKRVVASEIVATAQSVPGVLWSRVTQLQRVGQGDAGELAAGFLALGPAEIARVDNTGFPEDGTFTLQMEGGR
jgi:predicted phage baseplate assembly protein